MYVRNVIVGFLLSFIFLELAAPALQFLFDQNIETLVILSEKDTEGEENVKNQKINSSIIFENFTSDPHTQLKEISSLENSKLLIGSCASLTEHYNVIMLVLMMIECCTASQNDSC